MEGISVAKLHTAEIWLLLDYLGGGARPPLYLRSYPISTIVRLSGKLAMVEFYHLAYVRQVTT